MDAHAYPGKGLSLSQLVFALNQELKHASYSPSFTFDDVSQLDQDISTTLATVREWRNSFLRINRIPLDILSLIPTHLDSQKDRFWASSVCRHWRRTFLQHAVLWSQLDPSRGEAYMKTMLERAKGSPLDITIKSLDPIGTITLLPPHATQIRALNFEHIYWTKIESFLEINSGPLPLLRVLRIITIEEFNLDGPDVTTPPTLPLFTDAVNLREFYLHSEGSPFLNHFVFPNLTRFELVAAPAEARFRASLLEFLKASPTLQIVHLKIVGRMPFEVLPQRKVVLLPNVEVFTMVVDDGGSGYEIATHISCPSAKHTLLVHEIDADNITEEMFPNPVSWDAIARQYTRGPVEEVTLEIKSTYNTLISCSLTFQSPDASVLVLDYKVAASKEDDPAFPFEEMHGDVFSEASRTIQEHPLLANVKRVHIDHRFFVYGSERIVEEAGRLFKSIGPLDKLSICNSDPFIYLGPFVNDSEPQNAQRPVVLPPTKELTISHPLQGHHTEKCAAVIVGLAMSHHTLGTPFEHVTVYMQNLPTMLAERLEPWVGGTDCHEEMMPDLDF